MEDIFNDDSVARRADDPLEVEVEVEPECELYFKEGYLMLFEALREVEREPPADVGTIEEVFEHIGEEFTFHARDAAETFAKKVSGEGSSDRMLQIGDFGQRRELPFREMADILRKAMAALHIDQQERTPVAIYVSGRTSDPQWYSVSARDGGEMYLCNKCAEDDGWLISLAKEWRNAEVYIARKEVAAFEFSFEESGPEDPVCHMVHPFIPECEKCYADLYSTSGYVKRYAEWLKREHGITMVITGNSIGTVRRLAEARTKAERDAQASAKLWAYTEALLEYLEKKNKWWEKWKAWRDSQDAEHDQAPPPTPPRAPQLPE